MTRSEPRPLDESGFVAHSDQLSGTRLVQVTDGSGAGMRILEVWTRAGLHAEILLDRGFDLFSVRHRGVPVSWAGPPGLRSATAYEPTDFGWLRTFHGGLLTTCGLEHFGGPTSRPAPELAPPDDRVVHYGEHGRISHQGADLIRREILHTPAGDVIALIGEVRQAALYAEQFLLRRTIEIPVDQPTIRITDVVTNIGSLPVRNALLYHINLGYPLVAPGTEVSALLDKGPHAEMFPALTADAPERVDLWPVVPGPGGDSRITVASPSGSPQLELSYDAATLPALFVWKLPRSRVNVLGIAPASAASPDEAPILGTGESVEYRMSFRINSG
jgi:hypothetical protein